MCLTGSCRQRWWIQCRLLSRQLCGSDCRRGFHQSGSSGILQQQPRHTCSSWRRYTQPNSDRLSGQYCIIFGSSSIHGYLILSAHGGWIHGPGHRHVRSHIQPGEYPESVCRQLYHGIVWCRNCLVLWNCTRCFGGARGGCQCNTILPVFMEW